MPKNGRPFVDHRFLKRLNHAVDRIEPAAAVGKGADARQHHAVRRRHRARIVGYDDRLIEAGVAGGAFEGFRRRVQIARAVIDDRDAHRLTPGSGNSPTTSVAVGVRGIGDDGGGGGPGGAAVGPGGGVCCAADPSVKKSAFGFFNIVTADDTDVLPAAARQL